MSELVTIKNNEEIIISETAVEKLKQFQRTKLQMDLYEKEIKEQIKEAMKKCGIIHMEFNGIYADITQVKARETIDSAKLKKELPEIAKEYTKIGEPSERFTFKIND